MDVCSKHSVTELVGIQTEACPLCLNEGSLTVWKNLRRALAEMLATSRHNKDEYDTKVAMVIKATGQVEELCRMLKNAGKGVPGKAGDAPSVLLS